jgi:hypothetical protein
MDMQREIKLTLTVEQIELILDMLNSTDAEDIYGYGHTLGDTGFYDSKDYQLEMIARQLTSALG